MFGAELAHFGDGIGIRGRGGPGTGATGEDLEAVGVEFEGFGGCVVEGAGGGGMDADTADGFFRHWRQDSAGGTA